MGRDAPATLRKVTVGLPFGLGSAEWEADDSEQRAAWSLYVELITRVAVEPLDDNHGMAREALNSLYQLFPTTREILRQAGPSVGGRMPSVGALAVEVLNRGLRPFLTKWHPELLHWESQRSSNTSPRDHERAFPGMAELRRELKDLQSELRTYARALAAIAGVESAS